MPFRGATQVKRLKCQSEEDPNVAARCQRRTARELATSDQTRVSSTDAEANVTKMADARYGPTYNGLLVTDNDSPVILGVEVITRGNDMAQLTPKIEQVEERHGRNANAWLEGGVYPAENQIEQTAGNTIDYASASRPNDPDADPHAREGGDSDAVGAWRERMSTEAAKAVYNQRAATAECLKALARKRGLTRPRVHATATIASRGTLETYYRSPESEPHLCTRVTHCVLNYRESPKVFGSERAPSLFASVTCSCLQGGSRNRSGGWA